uniref:23S rRNA-intervening sequence protein n=1 Tax=Siphoviridae sp. ctRIT4 TaxID=2827869 RepID=A0A8S5SRG2_9CAUD|nr:MAG TPA: 23S rRNA-intervening sequence protein [Siphoviridae sp. ctRIT4]
MAVPATKRGETAMLYISNAEQLAAHIYRFVIVLSKRYSHAISDQLLQHSEEVVYHCRAANKVYVTDDATFEQRRSHLVEANSHLLHVESLLAVLCKMEMQVSAESGGKVKPPSESRYRGFAEMIEREYKLLAGCKSRDRQAYNKHKQAAGSGSIA